MSAPVSNLELEEYKTFIYPETIFTAVTAYQNQLVRASKLLPISEYVTQFGEYDSLILNEQRPTFLEIQTEVVK